MKFKKIEINGQTYPIAFGMFALSEFLEEAEISLAEIAELSQKMTLKNALTLAHIGLEDGARKAGQEYNNTFAETCDLFDEEGEGALDKVLEIFIAALPQEKEPEKKSKPQKQPSK